MKYFSISAVLLALAFVIGCQPPGDAGGEGGTDGNTTAVENQESTTPVSVVKISVPGMTCEGCAVGVQEALAGCDGIESVEVDATTKIATAKTKAGFDPQKAIDALSADQRFTTSTVIQ